MALTLPHVQLHWIHVHALFEFGVKDVHILLQHILDLHGEGVKVSDLLIYLLVPLFHVQYHFARSFSLLFETHLLGTLVTSDAVVLGSCSVLLLSYSFQFGTQAESQGSPYAGSSLP